MNCKDSSRARSLILRTWNEKEIHGGFLPPRVCAPLAVMGSDIRSFAVAAMRIVPMHRFVRLSPSAVETEWPIWETDLKRSNSKECSWPWAGHCSNDLTYPLHKKKKKNVLFLTHYVTPKWNCLLTASVVRKRENWGKNLFLQIRYLECVIEGMGYSQQSICILSL